MGILTDLKPSKPTTACKIRTLAATLEEADSIILLQAVDDPNWKVTPLADELTRRGISITKEPISKHRNRTCSCFKI